MKADAVCVMLFASIHDVMAAEHVLKSRDLWCDMIPTPRQLSSDCGMVSLSCFWPPNVDWNRFAGEKDELYYRQ